MLSLGNGRNRGIWSTPFGDLSISTEISYSQYRPQSQIQQGPIPYVVHDNRTFIGNDWQYTSGNTPRISQTISSYYMGGPPQTPTSYHGPQDYQEQPGFHAYSVPFPLDQGVPKFQPSLHDQRIPQSQPPIDTNPPPYQQPSSLYPHHAQTRAPSTRRRAIYKRRQPPVPDELNAVNTMEYRASPTRNRAAVVDYAFESRAMNDREVMPAPITVCNEPTSREHFNTLMSRLRSFSTEPNQENAAQISSRPPTARGGGGGGQGRSVMTPQPEIMLSGKELFEKAKREDKTGKYDNCYWDDRMDCFVNRAAGDACPFWKR